MTLVRLNGDLAYQSRLPGELEDRLHPRSRKTEKESRGKTGENLRIRWRTQWTLDAKIIVSRGKRGRFVNECIAALQEVSCELGIFPVEGFSASSSPFIRPHCASDFSQAFAEQGRRVS